jgi:phosphoribosylanthranilate isomerase
MSLKIKICGMRESENIMEAAELKPDMLGFIFHSHSLRYANGILDPEITAKLSGNIRKAGVFVNADFVEITRVIRRYSLDVVQLHGTETPELCSQLNNEGISVIKAISTKENTDFNAYSDYVPHTKYFLFDTLTPEYGGSGRKFDWKILDKYNLGHPFFLSGGINCNDVKNILEISNSSFYGIDLNSRFEIKPGLKDIGALKTFISEIRFNNNSL